MELAKVDLSKATLRGIEAKERIGTSVAVPETFSEVDIFCLFLERFGKPNGFMTFLAKEPNGDSDALWKWDYIFNLPEIGTIEVCRSWKNIEIHTRRI